MLPGKWPSLFCFCCLTAFYYSTFLFFILQSLRDNVELLCNAGEMFYNAGDYNNAKCFFQRVNVFNYYYLMDFFSLFCDSSLQKLGRDYYFQIGCDLLIRTTCTNDCA